MRPLAAAAVIVVAATLAGGCSGGGSEVTEDASLTVYVSLPLRGPSGAEGRDAADGARLALTDAGDEAGGTAVSAEFLDDTEGAPGEARWTPAQAAANARAATQDSTAIAYLGDFESGATRASLPVTNAARMLQVSPASAAGDLIAPSPGSDDVPETQPSGSRTFGRVIPSDRAQAEAGAGWVDELGFDRVGTQSDGTEFGDQMVAAFEQALRGAAVVRAGVELLYYGGGPDLQPASLSETVDRLMVSDAELAPGVFEPRGTLATSAALDPTQLPPVGKEFAGAFESAYGHRPGRYAAYGHEAMAVILDSIDRASDPADRPAVIEAFFETTDRDSVLGRYSITTLGETTLDRMTGYELGPAQPKPIARIGGSG
ncbi:MAG TPA: ABC transporter substrate-binding protein [Solirubrobacterales bacterium]